MKRLDYWKAQHKAARAEYRQRTKEYNQAARALFRASQKLDRIEVKIAIETLRARLAQPEPETCGYDETTGNCTQNPCCYPSPPQREWQGLTDDEHMKLAEEWGCMSADWVLYAAAIERKIKEKNT